MSGSPRTVFGHLAAFVLRHNRAVAIVVALLTIASLGVASTLEVDSNLLSLMPDDEPAIAALQELEEKEGGVNLVSVAVTGEPEDTGPFMAELAQTLSGSELVDYALYDVDDELAWRLGVINMEIGALEEIRDRLKGALALGPAIQNPFIAGRLLDLGPLTEQLSQADARRGVMSAGAAGDDGPADIERLIIRPAGAARDLPFARALMAEIYGTIEAMDPEARGVVVEWVGGAYRSNVEDYEGIRADMRWTAAAAFLLVLTLLAFALRDVRALFLLFLPLLVGTAWSFGFAGLTLGVLNTFTAVFGAVLVGMGIDFAIHLYTRYREERMSAPDLEAALIRAWDAAGPPCTAAAVTSAGGFCALLFADFQGFSQMGLLLAFGVMACLVSVLVLMPILVKWREKDFRPWHRRELQLRTKRPPTYRLAPVAFLLLSLVTVVAVFLLGRIQFEYDLSELRRDGSSYAELTELERELTRLSLAPTVASYPDADSLLQAHVAIGESIDDGSLLTVDRRVSLHSVIPSDQDVKLGVVAEIKEFSGHENYELLPESIRNNLGVLQTVPLQPVTTADLPRGLQHVTGASSGEHRLLLFPGGNVYDLRFVEQMKAELEALMPNVSLAGEFLGLGALASVIKRDAPIVGIGALVLVMIGTLLDLRKPSRAFGAMALLLAGMVWAGAAVGLARVKLSIVNIVGIPILLGIGVDVVIHLLHRLEEEGPGRVLKALSTTGWASGLSAATTVLSFASLALATNRGIQSLGMLVLVGLTTVTIAAFLFVPTGWMTVWKIAGDAPADPPRDRER
ncbi:MAG TPA: MMPL family transporter [Myxococcota bacterium]|nr:MMPL family transporter [Myxococcota bacterium]